MMAFGGAGIRPYDVVVYMYRMILLIILTLVYIIP